MQLPAGFLLMLSVRPKFSYLELDTRGMIQMKAKGAVTHKWNPTGNVRRSSGMNWTKSFPLALVDGVGQLSSFSLSRNQCRVRTQSCCSPGVFVMDWVSQSLLSKWASRGQPLPTFSSLWVFSCPEYRGKKKKPDLDVLWIFQVLIYTCK